MKPRFQHDCDACTFLGQGVYQKTPVDWYVCGSRPILCLQCESVPQGLRTIIARSSDDPPEYASMVIGGTVEPSTLVMAALAQGLELNEAEKDSLLKALLRDHLNRMGIRFFQDCLSPEFDGGHNIGPSDWLTLDLPPKADIEL